MIIRFPSPGAKRYYAVDSICSKCLWTVSNPGSPYARRIFTTASSRSATLTGASRLRKGYFLYNAFLEPNNGSAKFTGLTTSAIDAITGPNGSSNELESSISKAPPHAAQVLPHRRRRKARQEAAAAASDSKPEFPSLPPDASSSLTTISSRLPTNSAQRLFSTLLALSKPRLSFLIVLTATSAYTLYPVPALLSPSITDTPSLSALTLFFLTVGTSLTCSSANTLNMLYEPKWDAMMSRTRNRPLVRGLISSRGALIFAILTGASGVAALYYGVNPTVAFLGGFNIFLYAGVYTPLKRVSAINTWVGAIVGGIPPLMGWAAAAGQNATGSGDWQSLLLGEQSIGGWLLAGLLFAWQFPHFMALSWPIREEYKIAGHQMLCWTNPSRNGRVALRYSLLFMPICVALCYVGITEWSFAVASVPVNVWLARQAWRFWRYEGFKGSARGLFWASVWHLPVLMVLAMVEKKGLWARVWRAAVGEPEDEDDGEWIDDDEDSVEIEGATHAVVQTASLSR